MDCKELIDNFSHNPLKGVRPRPGSLFTFVTTRSRFGTGKSLPSKPSPASVSRSGRSDAPLRLRSALRKKWCLRDSTALFCNSNNSVFVHKRLEVQPLSADTAIEFWRKTFARTNPLSLGKPKHNIGPGQGGIEAVTAGS